MRPKEDCEYNQSDEFSGFHSNIVTALEDLKTDEAFVDVTLSCDGETIQVREKELLINFEDITMHL